MPDGKQSTIRYTVKRRITPEFDTRDHCNDGPYQKHDISGQGTGGYPPPERREEVFDKPHNSSIPEPFGEPFPDGGFR